MIYLRNISNNVKTVEDVLDALFYFNGDEYVTNETFSDEKRENIQCDENCNRSFEDIIEMVQTYLPHITDKEIIIQTIDYMFLKNIDLKCPNIKKYEHFEKTGENLDKAGWGDTFAIVLCPDINKVVVAPGWSANGHNALTNLNYVKTSNLTVETALLLAYGSYKQYFEDAKLDLKINTPYSLNDIFEIYKNK